MRIAEHPLAAAGLLRPGGLAVLTLLSSAALQAATRLVDLAPPVLAGVVVLELHLEHLLVGLEHLERRGPFLVGKPIKALDGHLKVIEGLDRDGRLRVLAHKVRAEDPRDERNLHERELRHDFTLLSDPAAGQVEV